DRVASAIKRLQDAGIEVSLFLDADEPQIDAARELGATAVELHTGQYALARRHADRSSELQKRAHGARWVHERGLTLHAGHGLTYQNVQPIAQLPHMTELNIGHSIVSRAIMVGFQQAVREMKDLIASPR